MTPLLDDINERAKAIADMKRDRALPAAEADEKARRYIAWRRAQRLREPCEYCGGRLRTASRIAAHPTEYQKYDVVTRAATIVCERCGCEPSHGCMTCRTITRPCSLCNGQRCNCMVSGVPVHYAGGVSAVRAPLPENVTEVYVTERKEVEERLARARRRAAPDSRAFDVEY